jgi:glucosamine--fructose-6-phosphate aminotransferase (isomerizing)
VTSSHLTDTTLWRETALIPETLATTIERAVIEPDLARFFRSTGRRRIVATGNGAAYYVALSLQLASLADPVDDLDVIAIPAGLLATDHFRWRQGDRLLAISSSGEMGDVIAALDRDAPADFAAITATPESTIGRRATSKLLVEVATQDSSTHTQAYVGNVAAVLALWAQLSEDDELLAEISSLPTVLDSAVGAASAWADEQIGKSDLVRGATVFGSGPAWPAALEVALLLKEIAAVAAEGMETREGATTGMYALDQGYLAVSVSGSDSNPSVEAAERVCDSRGATVVALRAPGADARFIAITTFPYAVALAGTLGLTRGLDVDHPPWLDAYYAAARPEGTTETSHDSPR